MATIDELIVRLDADMKPLQTALGRATALLKGFGEMAERALAPSARTLAAIEGRNHNIEAPWNNLSHKGGQLTK